MNSETKTILAVAPGKKLFGIAVFDGVELTYFALTTLKNGNTIEGLESEVAGLIEELIVTFKPSILAIRSISQYQKISVTIEPITRFVERQANETNIPIVKVSLAEIGLVLGMGEGRSTQKIAYDNLAVLYPELKRYLNQPNKWQTEYYNQLLAAVSVGVVCLKSISRPN